MPKVKISEYSATANSNTDVASINIDEGCAPSGINNAIRAVMGHLKDFQQGTNGDPFNGPVNGTLGATTASTANVTTLTTSSTVTHNGGTANGVAYLNGSKVLTTGSALVFDGTKLGIGTASPSNPLHIVSNTVSQLNVAASSGNTNAQINLEPTGTGIALIGPANSVAFAFRTNATERMYINTSGRVGVGILPTNTTKFQVVSDGNSVASFQDASAQGIKYVVATDGAGQIKHFATWEASGVDAYHAWYVTNSVGTQPQAMTLDASGNLLVGTTALNGTWTTPLTLSKNSGTTKWAVGPWVGGENSFIVSTGATSGVYLNGTSATSWSSNSDESLKENLVPIANAAEKVCSLRAVTGNYIEDEEKTSHAFLIAQDVQAVLPEAVATTTRPDGTEVLGLAYTETIPLLVAAIQEQQALITQLTARITALEGASA